MRECKGIGGLHGWGYNICSCVKRCEGEQLNTNMDIINLEGQESLLHSCTSACTNNTHDENKISNNLNEGIGSQGIQGTWEAKYAKDHSWLSSYLSSNGDTGWKTTYRNGWHWEGNCGIHLQTWNRIRVAISH